MIVGKSLGEKITLQQFKAMTEREQFANVRTSVEAITHLEKATHEAGDFEERMRSRFGADGLKKSVQEGRDYYASVIGEDK